MPKFSELIAKKDLTDRERADLVAQAELMEASLYDMEDLVNAIKGAGLAYRAGKLIAGQGSVTIDKNGISLASGTSTAEQVRWLAALGRPPAGEIGRIFTVSVGSAPNRYGLLIVQAEPEAGATDAGANGWLELRSYDHDGSADDVLRGTAQLTAGTFVVTLNDTSEAAVNKLKMNQTQTVLNDQGEDVDTIIEGENVADAFKLDAGNDLLQFGVAVEYEQETVTDAADTLDHTNHTVFCDCTSNAITINLPAASGAAGRIYRIKKIDSTANAVTVDGDSGETIDDGTTAVLTAQYEAITIQSDGSEWWIL